jgi:hypothetical protein
VLLADSASLAVFRRPIAGIAGSNPAELMDVLLLCGMCYVGSGLCDELITRSEESYRVCVCLCVLETKTNRQPRRELDCCATKKKCWWCLRTEY